MKDMDPRLLEMYKETGLYLDLEANLPETIEEIWDEYIAPYTLNENPYRDTTFFQE